MALSAYAGSGYLVFYAGYGIGIFSFIWTLLFICYIEITTFWAPQAYNKYAHLVLECLSVIFWLSTFASLAVVAAAWDWGYSAIATCYGGYCVKLKARSYDYNGPANATKAAAALGAIEWALFCGTLITYGIYLHRNRANFDAYNNALGIVPTSGGGEQIDYGGGGRLRFVFLGIDNHDFEVLISNAILWAGSKE